MHECPICFEKIAGCVVTECSHLFCEDCLVKWITERRAFCPLCVQPVYGINTHSDDNEFLHICIICPIDHKLCLSCFYNLIHTIAEDGFVVKRDTYLVGFNYHVGMVELDMLLVFSDECFHSSD